MLKAIISRLRGNAGRDKAALETVAPIAGDEKASAGIRVPHEAVMRSRANPAAVTPAMVFSAAQHPPGVGPGTGSGMAMDEAVDPGVQSWATGALTQASLSGFWTEGITFLGYPYLSELAQRPEYRMICETTANEMTREWIEFTKKGNEEGDSEDGEKKIAELTAEFERLNVRDIFCRAAQQDGFFGRGHIYVDTGDTDDRPELQMSIGNGWDATSKAKIKKGGIKALRTVEAVWCYPTSYNSNDPLKPDWYYPDTWYVQSKIVHRTRLLTLIGREVPDLLKPTYSFGGLSLSQMAKPYVDNWLRTRQGVNDIINSFSQFVLLTNLQQSIQGDGQQLFDRVALFNNLRSNQGTMVLDKETEEFKNVSASLAGLDALQAQAQEHMCSVSHTPMVKLLGIQPAGLNADSEGILESYEQWIHSYQEHLFRKPLHQLMGLIMLGLWGKVDDTIGFEFRPLSSLDELELSEVEKVKAERDQILVDTGALSPSEVRSRVAHDPRSDYASIDVDETPDLLDEEEEGLAPHGHMIKNLGQNEAETDSPF